MTTNQKRANKEVLVILKKLDLEQAIPNEVIKNLEENQDNDWNFVYDDSLALEEQKILRETAILFSSLYIMYISNDDNEKEELKQIYKSNEEISNEKNEFESYIKNVRNNGQVKEDSNENVMSNLPTSVKKSLFDKIKQWLKSIFKK